MPWPGLARFWTEWTIRSLGAKSKKNAAAIELSQASDSDLDVPVPDGLEYLPFQRAGIAYAASREATLIADEMGLGKTIQAAGLINLTTPHSVLIICPASLKLNWQNELNRWLVRERSIDVVSGDEWPDSEEDIVIINYDILARNKHSINSKLWDLVIFDEAHYCKNPKAERTKMALSIKANRKLMLTGTPMINRPVELQPLAGYLAPEEFGSLLSIRKALLRRTTRLTLAGTFPAHRIWPSCRAAYVNRSWCGV